MNRVKTSQELRCEIKAKVAKWIAQGNKVTTLPATKASLSGWKQWNGKYMGIAHIER